MKYSLTTRKRIMCTDNVKILKIGFGFVTSILFLLGLSITTMASWILINPDQFFEIISEHVIFNGTSITRTDFVAEMLDRFMVDHSLYLVLGAGTYIMFINGIGCIGNCTKSTCSLCVYIFLTIIAILVQLAGLIFVVSLPVWGGEQKIDAFFIEILGQADTTSTASRVSADVPDLPTSSEVTSTKT